MHISRALVFAAVLGAVGCVGEAEWALVENPAPAAAAAPAAERTRLSTFQGLSSGLPSGAVPVGIAHLDAVVYLVSAGQLFSLASGAKAWSPVSLALGAGEQVLTVVRVDLALFVTTSAGLLRLDWGGEAAKRVANAPAGGWGLVKKGGELLLATSSGLFVSVDGGASFSLRASGPLFAHPGKALVASAAAQRIFASGASAHGTGGLFHSDDGGLTWAEGLVAGEVKAVGAAGQFVLVETATAGALRSDNYGNTFHPVPVGGASFSFGFSGKKAFAGTMNGVRVSDDGGASWLDGNQGLPAAAPVNAVLVAGPAVVASTGGQVYVAELN